MNLDVTQAITEMEPRELELVRCGLMASDDDHAEALIRAINVELKLRAGSRRSART